MKKVTGKIFDIKLFNKLMNYSHPYRGTYYLVLVSAILLSTFSVLSPYLLKTVVDDYITPKDYDGLLFISFLMLVTLILETVFQFIFIYYANWIGQMIVKDIRIELFQKIVRFKMAYFDTSAVGRLVTRAVSDIETIASIFSQGLFMIVADLLKMLVVIVIMLYVNWKLSLIVFSILPVILYATLVFQKAMKQAFEDVRKQVANLNTFVQERISGMKIVQLFNRELYEQNTFIEINNKHKKAWLKTVWFNSIFFPIAEISTSITIGLLVWYGGLNVVASGSISLGIIFLFIQLSQILFRPLRQIADKFNTLQMGMVAANRVFLIFESGSKSQIEDKGTFISNEMRGKIEIENLCFSYIPGELVLKKINLEVQPGETVAIVGATGAGKSTIINLLSRLYEFDSGDIRIDNISIRDYSIKNLRNNVAVVLQDVFLFADTIYNNITLYNPKITLEDVQLAAKKIGIHQFLNSLPGGYQYNVKERGIMLSSGQRQLIAFLRAFLINPAILVLDEATSSIDSYSEELIQSAIKNITKDKTSIIIAHRLATIQNADKVIVIEQGEIVEIGSHRELLRKKGGYYYKLYQTQFVEAKV